MTIYLVLDEYEQRDGYFGYDLAFENRKDAEKAAETLREKADGKSYHDVFEISTDYTLEGYLAEHYGDET